MGHVLGLGPGSCALMDSPKGQVLVVLAAGMGGVPIETERTSELGTGAGSILQGIHSRPGGVLISKDSRHPTGAMLMGSSGLSLCCAACNMSVLASSA